MKQYILIIGDTALQTREIFNQLEFDDKHFEPRYEAVRSVYEIGDTVYTLRSITNQDKLRGKCYDQVFYCGNKCLFELEKGRHAIGMIFEDMLRQSCVPEDYKLQKI